MDDWRGPGHFNKIPKMSTKKLETPSLDKELWPQNPKLGRESVKKLRRSQIRDNVGTNGKVHHAISRHLTRSSISNMFDAPLKIDCTQMQMKTLKKCLDSFAFFSLSTQANNAITIALHAATKKSIAVKNPYKPCHLQWVSIFWI